jgi:hypothetical protein
VNGKDEGVTYSAEENVHRERNNLPLIPEVHNVKPSVKTFTLYHSLIPSLFFFSILRRATTGRGR